MLGLKFHHHCHFTIEHACAYMYMHVHTCAYLKPLVQDLQLLPGELGILHGGSEQRPLAGLLQVLPHLQQCRIAHALDGLIGNRAEGLGRLLQEVGHGYWDGFLDNGGGRFLVKSYYTNPTLCMYNTQYYIRMYVCIHPILYSILYITSTHTMYIPYTTMYIP